MRTRDEVFGPVRRVGLRFTDADYADMKSKARELNLSPSGYMRMMIGSGMDNHDNWLDTMRRLDASAS